jgi:hypothetical protein
VGQEGALREMTMINAKVDYKTCLLVAKGRHKLAVKQAMKADLTPTERRQAFAKADADYAAARRWATQLFPPRESVLVEAPKRLTGARGGEEVAAVGHPSNPDGLEALLGGLRRGMAEVSAHRGGEMKFGIKVRLLIAICASASTISRRTISRRLPRPS